MNNYFKQGFTKAAAHVLAELSYNNDDSEHQQKRQAIIEASYNNERDRNTEDYQDQEQRDTGKVVKQESPVASGLGHKNILERS